MPAAAQLTVSNLTKRYGKRTAVDHISFSVKRGEIVGFLGPNGAGKSTTLRMITGFVTPSAGQVRVGEVDAIAEPIEARKRIGYMAEGVPLYPEMRTFEYLRYRAELKGIRGRAAIDDAMEKALKQAHVDDVRERILGQLSKGYRQRVGLADALLGDPPLLILDEPTSGLDPNQIRSIRTLVKSFGGTKTVFLSTHILPEVEATCTRVLILNKGKLVGEGEPSELRARTAGAIRFEGRGAIEKFREALEPLDASVELEEKGELVSGRLQIEGEDGTELVFRAVADAGLALRDLRGAGSSLEDVFASVTTEESSRSEEEE